MSDLFEDRIVPFFLISMSILVVGALCMAFYSHTSVKASERPNYAETKIFTVHGAEVERFYDPDTNMVCYAMAYVNSSSIECFDMAKR
jgi:hypothetical protein